ncbi:hypothetical protein E5676_scaffold432G00080 [Cucumis melo var. makuwa]|uniref:Uncharacterized protein n=1 Tax=Cucumis melo var. makuwa TaxID=1194695 RepID=A0A5D3C230_CUCMM|nr:hypothetical protein E5676_scaffold432G00080 [Cucumis melo var. makuwa]
MKFDNNLSSKTQRDLPVVRCASTIDNTKEKVLITRNAEFGVRSEIKLILCLIQQCLEQRVIEKANFDYKPSLILTYIDNQVTLRDVSWDEAILMQRRPQNPLAAVLTGCARYNFTSYFPPFVCTCSYKPPLLHIQYVALASEFERKRDRERYGIKEMLIGIYKSGWRRLLNG